MKLKKIIKNKNSTVIKSLKENTNKPEMVFVTEYDSDEGYCLQEDVSEIWTKAVTKIKI